jgi:hypothetical protein
LESTAVTELRKFVSSVLTEIAAGVADANGVISELGGNVNPAIAATDAVYDAETRRRVVDVTFDVSVEAASEQGNTGKVGVLIATIGLGTERRTGSTDKATQRIQFSVPVVLPIYGTQRAKELADEQSAQERVTRVLTYPNL